MEFDDMLTAEDAAAVSIDSIVDSKLVAVSDNFVKSYRKPEIPTEVLKDYRDLKSERNYWSSKFSNLVDAARELIKYNIDIDYTELILRTKEAARFEDYYQKQLSTFENLYPDIDNYDDVVLGTLECFDNVDPIINNRAKRMEHKMVDLNRRIISFKGFDPNSAIGYGATGISGISVI